VDRRRGGVKSGAPLTTVASAAGMTPLLLLLPRWTRSFAAGAYVATLGGLLVNRVLLRSGAASLAMGEAGETRTAEELRRLHRRGWRVINRVVLGWGDIDHVALGPGRVVIETKWAADSWSGDDSASRIDAAVRQPPSDRGSDLHPRASMTTARRVCQLRDRRRRPLLRGRRRPRGARRPRRRLRRPGALTVRP